MAFTSVAALVGGAEVTAPLVLSAAAEVGTAMSVVGGVTGNKDLMKIGGAMSLVGGVGSMAAGALDSASSVGDALSSDTADASNVFNSAKDSQLANAQLGYEAPPAFSPAQDSNLANQNLGLDQPFRFDPAKDSQLASDQLGLNSGSSFNPAKDSQWANDTGSAAVDLGGPNPTDQRLAAGTQTSPPSPAGTGNNAGSGQFFNNINDWLGRNKNVVDLGTKLAGTLQQQYQADQANRLRQQQLNQTRYGNSVPSFYATFNSTAPSGAAPVNFPGIIDHARNS